MMKPPNVLLLYTDQQRWDTIHAGGFEYIHTPNLDRIAHSGVLFENTFCNSPVCMPSRQSMLSGQYPSSIGCGCNGIEMRKEVPHLATMLKRQGYHTASIGKLHFLNHSNRDHRIPHPVYGFDTIINSDEPGCYEDDYIRWVTEQDPDQVDNCRCSTPPAWEGEPLQLQPRNTHEPYVFKGPEHLTHSAFVASETIRYIEEQKDNPFFCIAGFYAPHTPLNPPQRFVDMYDPATLPRPYMNEGENKLGLTDADWQKVKAYYYALISHVDDQVGRILDALGEHGLTDHTLVVFTADHGEHLGDHGLVQKGPPGLDSCSHVPLLLSLPGRIPAGGRRSELTELIDVAPTILDYCGADIPPILQGHSVRPLLDGQGYEPRHSVYQEYLDPFVSSWKSIRTHTHKYCASGNGTELLYDLESDPHELTNVAADPEYREWLDIMRRTLLDRWFTVEKHHPPRSGRY